MLQMCWSERENVCEGGKKKKRLSTLRCQHRRNRGETRININLMNRQIGSRVPALIELAKITYHSWLKTADSA